MAVAVIAIVSILMTIVMLLVASVIITKPMRQEEHDRIESIKRMTGWR